MVAFINLDTNHLLHYVFLAILVVIHTFLLLTFCQFEGQCRIKNRREKVIFEKRLKIVCIMAVVQLITGISLFAHLFWCLPYSYSLFSLTEYVLLILLGGHTKLSCDLLLLEKMSP